MLGPTELNKLGFTWSDDMGYGHIPVKSQPYDEKYFDKYVAYAASARGQQINQFRLSFISQFIVSGPTICDVGIGCGAFVSAMKAAGHKISGYDINPAGVDWLKKFGFYRDPHKRRVDVLTFWDVLEHIEDMETILSCARKWVFVSMPIYQNMHHCILSRHFRPDEHCHYFTRDGFVRRMRSYRWDLCGWSLGESLAGREDIESFAFRRA